MLELDPALRVRRRSSGSAGSALCSSTSSSSKTRSAEAMPDCSTLAIDASWVSGWVNWREYWMNACTSPMRQRARRHPQPADHGDGDEVEVAEEHHRRLDGAGDELGAEARLVELLVLVAEALLDVVLAAEHLHQRVAGERLLDLGVERAGVAPLGDEPLLRPRGDELASMQQRQRDR